MKKLFLLFIIFTYTRNLVNAQNIDSTVQHAASVFMASGPGLGSLLASLKTTRFINTISAARKKI